MPPKLHEHAKRLLAHKFTDEGGQEYEGTEFGGFGQYIHNKVLKLQNQAQEQASKAETRSDIFRGCVIYITGYTRPSIGELKRLITENGGVHAQYMSGKSYVTHIIAGSLTARKRQEYAKLKVVKPEWIVDSVNNGKLANWADYRTINNSVVIPPKFVQRASVTSPPKLVRSPLKPPTLVSVKSPSEATTDSPVGRIGDRLDQSMSRVDKLILSCTANATRQSPVIGEPHPPPGEVDRSGPFSSVEHSDDQILCMLPANPAEPDCPLVQVDRPQIPTTAVEYRQEAPKTAKRPETTVVEGRPETSTKAVELDRPQTANSQDADALHVAEFDSFELSSESERPADQLSWPETPSKQNTSPLKTLEVNDTSRTEFNCLDPDFIPSYYRKSRLHHLSTWKVDLKRRFQALATKQNAKNSQTPSAASRQKIIVHVDFDSFFVAVALLKRPDLSDKPVCVSYGSSGNSDVASCNYVARKFGVRNGMWISHAIKKCPQLVALPYDFAGYETASTALYNVLLDLNPDILFPVSVDEALLDVTSCVDASDVEAVMEYASKIRNKIRIAAGIEVSVGAGPNVLLAKIALHKAKPAGQQYIPAFSAQDALDGVLIEDLPGVGRHIAGRINEKFQIQTAGQIRRQCQKSELEALLGAKVGAKVYNYAFGHDDTDISHIPAQKSIGVEIAWGVRVKNHTEVDIFVTNLAAELCRRMKQSDDVMGKHLTVKIYQRAKNAPQEPPKFLGCGMCDTYSKSQALDARTNAVDRIATVAKRLVEGFGCPPLDLRGVGIQMKLDDEPDDRQTTIPMAGPNLFRVSPAPKRPAERPSSPSPSPKKPRPFRSKIKVGSRFQPQINMSVLAELPTQIRNEILEEHGLLEEQQRQPRRNALRLPSYKPVEFYGRVSMDDIRLLIAQWIDSTRGAGPHYDDVCAFERFLKDSIANDRDWGKVVRLLEWMTVYTRRTDDREWCVLVDIYDRIARDELSKRGIRLNWPMKIFK
jgi:DNA repair protein REV1